MNSFFKTFVATFVATLVAVVSVQAAVNVTPGGPLYPNPYTTNGAGGAHFNGFVFIGDSLTDQDARNKPTTWRTDWPSVLLRQSNYWQHAVSTNAGHGGSTAAQWAATYYDTYVHPLAPLMGASNYYCFVWIGNNDMSDSEATITNNIWTIWLKAKADGMKVVAMTDSTNTGWNFTQLTLWTNLCRDIRAASNVWTSLIDVATLVTNAAVQTVDGKHLTAATHTNLALYISQHLQPGLSGFYSKDPPPTEFVGQSRFDGSAEFAGGMFISGETAFSAPGGSDKSLQILHYNGSLNSAGGVIQETDSSNGGALASLTFLGNPLYVLAGPTTGPTMGIYGLAGGTGKIPGNWSVKLTPIVGAGTAATNLMTNDISANLLQVSGDSIDFTTTGAFSLTGQSKQLKLVYGSQTILDSGSQAVSNNVWVIRGKIYYTGATAQYATATLNWGGGPYLTTNVCLTLAQTNNIVTTLKVVGTSGVTSAITNESLSIVWLPAP